MLFWIFYPTIKRLTKGNTMFKKLLDFTGTKTFLFITLAVLTFECYDLEREIKKIENLENINKEKSVDIQKNKERETDSIFFFDYIKDKYTEGLA